MGGRDQREMEVSLQDEGKPEVMRNGFKRLEKDERSPRLMVTRSGTNATRPAICYQTSIYSDSATK